MASSDSAQRFSQEASRRGLAIEVERFPEGTKTARQAAEAVGCEVSAIVKSLVFMVDDQPVIALVPGDRRLNPARLADATAGEKVRRADLDEVRQATGYAPGGTPPFGHSRPLTVLADTCLRRHEWVWAAAGRPDAVFRVALDDLVAAAGATWAELSAD